MRASQKLPLRQIERDDMALRVLVHECRCGFPAEGKLVWTHRANAASRFGQANEYRCLGGRKRSQCRRGMVLRQPRENANAIRNAGMVLGLFVQSAQMRFHEPLAACGVRKASELDSVSSRADIPERRQIRHIS